MHFADDTMLFLDIDRFWIIIRNEDKLGSLPISYLGFWLHNKNSLLMIEISMLKKLKISCYFMMVESHF
jgi:hypothetical protein